MTEEERWRLIRASDRLLDVIEEWRLCDNPQSPVPLAWEEYYRVRLGGKWTKLWTIDRLYDATFYLQGDLMKGGHDAEQGRSPKPNPTAKAEIQRQRRAIDNERRAAARRTLEADILKAARSLTDGTTAERR